MNTTVSARRAWVTLGVLLTGMFISLLDATIVNVALPRKVASYGPRPVVMAE